MRGGEGGGGKAPWPPPPPPAAYDQGFCNQTRLTIRVKFYLKKKKKKKKTHPTDKLDDQKYVCRSVTMTVCF